MKNVSWKLLRHLKPKAFFIGVLGAFLACSILGHFISQKAYFKKFVRLYPSISPESQYYPTASELLVTAEHFFKEDKISVLVGGNSIFRGVGQNQDELWSQTLQKDLGVNYQVLNFALNGASPSAGAGVLLRMLVERYPKLIYTAYCKMNSGGLEGDEIYRYIFWDAYYKHLFHPDHYERKAIAELRSQELRSASGFEMHLLAYLDSWFYFRNLWNWVGYNYFFTIWSSLANNPIFKGRKYSYDEVLDYPAIKKVSLQPDGEVYKGSVNALKFLKNQLPTIFTLSQDHTNESFKKKIADEYRELYSPRYRNKFLCVWIPLDPYFTHILSKHDQYQYQSMTQEMSLMVKNLGYNSITVGNIQADNYLDLFHLLASGGNRLAQDIAPKITQISLQDGFLPSSTKAISRSPKTSKEG